MYYCSLYYCYYGKIARTVSHSYAYMYSRIHLLRLCATLCDQHRLHFASFLSSSYLSVCFSSSISISISQQQPKIISAMAAAAPAPVPATAASAPSAETDSLRLSYQPAATVQPDAPTMVIATTEVKAPVIQGLRCLILGVSGAVGRVRRTCASHRWSSYIVSTIGSIEYVIINVRYCNDSMFGSQRTKATSKC